MLFWGGGSLPLSGYVLGLRPCAHTPLPPLQDIQSRIHLWEMASEFMFPNLRTKSVFASLLGTKIGLTNLPHDLTITVP